VRFEPLPLPGAFRISLEPREDERGFFARTFCEEEFARHGLPTRFPQQNLSRNLRAGTLRGLHFNAAPHGEAKLIRCTAGALWDVIIDLRAGSPTRLRWFGAHLTAERGDALFLPAGFAHGFLTLEDRTDAAYLMGSAYAPGAARGIRWDDPALALPWPREPAVLSDQDRAWPLLEEALRDA
jgi:dTDP-4-dehydrorhamnose 3,5-epimerase